MLSKPRQARTLAGELRRGPDVRSASRGSIEIGRQVSSRRCGKPLPIGRAYEDLAITSSKAERWSEASLAYKEAETEAAEVLRISPNDRVHASTFSNGFSIIGQSRRTKCDDAVKKGSEPEH